jgi:hypothetical protein
MARTKPESASAFVAEQSRDELPLDDPSVANAEAGRCRALLTNALVRAGAD